MRLQIPVTIITANKPRLLYAYTWSAIKTALDPLSQGRFYVDPAYIAFDLFNLDRSGKRKANEAINLLDKFGCLEGHGHIFVPLKSTNVVDFSIADFKLIKNCANNSELLWEFYCYLLILSFSATIPIEDKSFSQLAQMMGKSRNTIIRRMRDLNALGLVQTEKQFDKNGGLIPNKIWLTPLSSPNTSFSSL